LLRRLLVSQRGPPVITSPDSADYPVESTRAEARECRVKQRSLLPARGGGQPHAASGLPTHAPNRTSPAVDPVCLKGALPRRARRVSAYNRSRAGMVGRRASLGLHSTLIHIGALPIGLRP
jgi:hypothetical protein